LPGGRYGNTGLQPITGESHFSGWGRGALFFLCDMHQGLYKSPPWPGSFPSVTKTFLFVFASRATLVKNAFITTILPRPSQRFFPVGMHWRRFRFLPDSCLFSPAAPSIHFSPHPPPGFPLTILVFFVLYPCFNPFVRLVFGGWGVGGRLRLFSPPYRGLFFFFFFWKSFELRGALSPCGRFPGTHNFFFYPRLARASFFLVIPFFQRGQGKTPYGRSLTGFSASANGLSPHFALFFDSLPRTHGSV